MKYKIAVFPGDGIGPELIEEGKKLVEKAAELEKFEIEWAVYPHGAEHYAETNEILDIKLLEEIKNTCSAIYCGTFDGMPEANSALIIREHFDQFVSLRPIKLLPSVESPIVHKDYSDIDFVIIRENSEDFYINAHGKSKNGKNKQQLEISKSSCKVKLGIDIESKGTEIAYQIGMLSKKGCERIARYAFEYAKNKGCKKINFIDKVDYLEYYNFWREIIEKISKDYSGIESSFGLVDNAVMQLIRQPEKFDVVVSPNMFGEILQNLGTVLQGGLSFGARANINPETISMFEPVHGHAPKLKGQGIVNPIAIIWAASLMLENIGQQKAADLVIKAVEAVLKDQRTRTHDLDGNNTTSEMAEAIIDKFVELHD